MKIIKVLETIELSDAANDSEKYRRIMYERIMFWKDELTNSEFTFKLIRENEFLHVVMIKRRKTRSDAGKERVNRTGFRRGINPLPRNLDKVPPFEKKN